VGLDAAAVSEHHVVARDLCDCGAEPEFDAAPLKLLCRVRV
jgi:hypothetical protein